VPQLSEIKEIEGKFNLPKNLRSATAKILFAMVLSHIPWHSGLPVDSGILSRTVGCVEPTLLSNDGIAILSPARIAEMKVGGEIVTIDGVTVNNFNAIEKVSTLGSKRDSFGQAKPSMQIAHRGRHLNLELVPVLVSENGSDRFRNVEILSKQELIVESVLSGCGG
jgi:hypothetical protein